MFLVNAAHQRSRRREDLINEDEDGLLRRKLDTLADDVDELANGEVGGDEILLLVDRGDVGFFDLFADYLTGASVVRTVTGPQRNGGFIQRSKDKTWAMGVGADSLEYGLHIFGEYARPQPCASRRGAHP